MIELVTGGSGSGKSAYAEDRICSLWKESGRQGGLYYIAAMIPFGEETKQKIRRHRRMRAGKGFETLEWHTGLAGHLQGNEVLAGACVLVECMSNLVANELYDESGAGRQAVDAIMEGIHLLMERCVHLVVVTNEVFSESLDDQEEMTFYKSCLGAINRRIGAVADRVTEVVCGVPVRVAREDAAGGGVRNMETRCCPVACSESEVEEGRRDCPECDDKEKQRDCLGREEKEEEIGCSESEENERGSVGLGREEKEEGIGYLESEEHERGRSCDAKMWLVTGGAFQGKREYAEQLCPDIRWADGAVCDLEEIRTCRGMNRFHLLIRRWMEAGRDSGELIEILRKRRSGRESLVLIVDEIGCGLVPVDAFERRYREEAGRVCTEAARMADRVDRVVCGIGVCIKGVSDKKEDGKAQTTEKSAKSAPKTGDPVHVGVYATAGLSGLAAAFLSRKRQ